MKVALYTRVSTEDQAREGFSLEVQRNYLLQYAKNFDWDVVCSLPVRDVYMDDGFSGGNMDRPALKKLLFDAKAKKFDTVLVYKIDRFARNNRMLLNLVEELSEINVGFKSATESFDTVTAAGKMALSMLGTVAQFERDRIVERVFPGMIKGVQRGNWQGARYAPYGYRYNKEKKAPRSRARRSRHSEADIYDVPSQPKHSANRRLPIHKRIQDQEWRKISDKTNRRHTKKSDIFRQTCLEQTPLRPKTKNSARIQVREE